MKNYSVHGAWTDSSSNSSSRRRHAAAASEPAPRREPAEKTAHVKGLEDDLASGWRSRSRSR